MSESVNESMKNLVVGQPRLHLVCQIEKVLPFVNLDLYAKDIYGNINSIKDIYIFLMFFNEVLFNF